MTEGENNMLTRFQPVDGYPVGYGKIPAFEESDPNFLIYRKFGWLHNSVLLHLQDELAGLEEDLKALDRHEFQDDETKLLSRRLDDALVGSTRIELLKRISCKPSECGRVSCSVVLAMLVL